MMQLVTKINRKIVLRNKTYCVLLYKLIHLKNKINLIIIIIYLKQLNTKRSLEKNLSSYHKIEIFQTIWMFSHNNNHKIRIKTI